MTDRIPMLLGDDSGVFGIRVGGGPGIGVVVCVTPSMTDSPAGLLLADRLALEGNTEVVIDEPGYGESYGDVEVGTALALACEAAMQPGAEAVALVVHAGLLDAALRLAESRDDVIGVASVSMPTPDPMAKLAAALGTGDLLRMGIRLSTLRKLLDSQARSRFIRVIRAKLLGTKEVSASAADPDVVPGLRSALADGKQVLLVAGVLDRASRAILELASGSTGEFLETDCTYRGRVSGFATASAQSWFAERVATWVRALGHHPI
jgi:hypothetical protein